MHVISKRLSAVPTHVYLNKQKTPIRKMQKYSAVVKERVGTELPKKSIKTAASEAVMIVDEEEESRRS